MSIPTTVAPVPELARPADPTAVVIGLGLKEALGVRVGKDHEVLPFDSLHDALGEQLRSQFDEPGFAQAPTIIIRGGGVHTTGMGQGG